MNSMALRYCLLPLFTFLFLSHFFVSTLIFVFEWMMVFLFSSFTTILLEQGILYVNGYAFDVIRACVAPSMYILFSIIFLTTPLELRTLFKQLGIALGLFTLFNIVRIIFMISITLVNPVLFDQLHFLFYELLSAVGFLLIGYFVMGALRKKKVYPLYSDLKELMKGIK